MGGDASTGDREAWYQYAKLREAIEEVIACLEVSAPQAESLPQVGTRQDWGGLRLVVSNGAEVCTTTAR